MHRFHILNKHTRSPYLIYKLSRSENSKLHCSFITNLITFRPFIFLVISFIFPQENLSILRSRQNIVIIMRNRRNNRKNRIFMSFKLHYHISSFYIQQPHSGVQRRNQNSLIGKKLNTSHFSPSRFKPSSISRLNNIAHPQFKIVFTVFINHYQPFN